MVSFGGEFVCVCVWLKVRAIRALGAIRHVAVMKLSMWPCW